MKAYTIEEQPKYLKGFITSIILGILSGLIVAGLTLLFGNLLNLVIYIFAAIIGVTITTISNRNGIITGIFSAIGGALAAFTFILILESQDKTIYLDYEKYGDLGAFITQYKNILLIVSSALFSGYMATKKWDNK